MAVEDELQDFSLADGRGYMLNRGYAAACRLNLQFYLWKDALGFNCHPSIPIQSGSRIADVATGTATWSIEVARAMPGVHIDALDIDLTQAPHPQWLPPNITLREWDIFQDVPNDLIGKYDCVDLRLLVLVVEGADRARAVIRNLLKLLKPGGYLQWDELDCVNMHIKRVHDGISSPAFDQLRDMGWSAGRHDWTLGLAKLIEEEGLENTKIEYYGDKDDMTRAFNEHHLLLFEEFAQNLNKVGKKEAAAAFYEVVGEAYAESITGAAICIPRIVCLGQKQG
ncbi:MAG: hypothetical protein Q9227_005132 [Pyrenula ochraceoflavens]